ncbi:gamma-interferon-responsive lysosomal thiol protein [Malania oleifera]|uniref:gamma-interferon-responsive lysosomal thiol protein n=1 Tax=Malania oleifera TaxID=397392 RepID=UPI0025AE508F|nr:gamma-interferon-responsive lysosomal thiol protein [Malania oleifera]
MASALSLSPLPYLFLLFIALSSPTSASASAGRIFNASAAQKVSLGLYYESLCPYSANFIVNYIAKIFQNGLFSIIDLNLVPFGNAKIGPSSTIDCQHGPSECLLNTVEACAINIWPDLNEHFTFIYCIESLVLEYNYPQWIKCFEKLGMDPKPIADCYNSGYGKELELRYAAETNTLQPPHEYVPWVVVNGRPLYQDYENFVRYVCEAYNGTTLPEACSDSYLNAMAKEKEASAALKVSYKEEKPRSALKTKMLPSIMRQMHMLFSL